jgi:hypothetical protein
MRRAFIQTSLSRLCLFLPSQSRKANQRPFPTRDTHTFEKKKRPVNVYMHFFQSWSSVSSHLRILMLLRMASRMMGKQRERGENLQKCGPPSASLAKLKCSLLTKRHPLFLSMPTPRVVYAVLCGGLRPKCACDYLGSSELGGTQCVFCSVLCSARER